MVGATGTGKTTLINRMINYLIGVNYTDPYRFQLIEETGRSKTKSQTTVYINTLYSTKHFHITFQS